MSTPTIPEQIAAIEYLFDARHGPHVTACLRATLAMLGREHARTEKYGADYIVLTKKSFAVLTRRRAQHRA